MDDDDDNADDTKGADADSDDTGDAARVQTRMRTEYACQRTPEGVIALLGPRGLETSGHGAKTRRANTRACAEF